MPIGIFDSGVGGLTVCREFVRAYPSIDFVYLGDTARLPYGTKSPSVVTSYALNAARFLLQHNVDAIIIACHTASSVALDAVAASTPVPVIGMVQPGADGIIHRANLAPNESVAVLGTRTTIASLAHANAIHATAHAANLPPPRVLSIPCPLFVPLAEEAETHSQIASLVAQKYLAPLANENLGAALLACTHFPLLRDTIAANLPPSVRLVDPAREAVATAAASLPPSALTGSASRKWFVTDTPDSFARMGQRFFAGPLDGSLTLTDLTFS